MALPVVLCEYTEEFPTLTEIEPVCRPLVGAVEVNVMWISDKTINNFESENVRYGEDIPASMEAPPGYLDWTANYSLTKRENWIKGMSISSGMFPKNSSLSRFMRSRLNPRVVRTEAYRDRLI